MLLLSLSKDEYVGTEDYVAGTRWYVELDSKTGDYEIEIPISFNETSFPVQIRGSFNIESYTGAEPLIAEEVTSDEGMMSSLAQQLESYPSSVIPGCIEQLRWWLENTDELNVTMQDLGFVAYQPDVATDYLYNTGGTDNESVIADEKDHASSNSNEQDTSNTPFTNKYGTPTTRCAHTGCNNYIASSGDTNCCTTHSNKCLDCGKYIDEDAMYCMDCLTKAAQQSGTGSYGISGSDNSSNIGEGGYEMPNENDKSFSDYVKRVDPDLYDELFSD